jgi:glycerol dehydrogenase
LLVQLVLEDRDAELMGDMLSFYQRIGLPRNLTELGVLNVDDSVLMQVAAPTLKAPHARNFFSVSGAALTCDELIGAMRALESLTHRTF